MSACRGDFQGAFDIFLAFDFGKIEFAVVVMLENFRDVHFRRRDFYFTFQKLRGFAEILDWNDLQAGNNRRFRRIFRRNQNSGFAVGFRAKRNRQNSFARPHRAGERKFAGDDKMIQLIRFNLFARGEHSNAQSADRSSGLPFSRRRARG